MSRRFYLPKARPLPTDWRKTGNILDIVDIPDEEQLLWYQELTGKKSKRKRLPGEKFRELGGGGIIREIIDALLQEERLPRITQFVQHQMGVGLEGDHVLDIEYETGEVETFVVPDKIYRRVRRVTQGVEGGRKWYMMRNYLMKRYPQTRVLSTLEEAQAKVDFFPDIILIGLNPVGPEGRFFRASVWEWPCILALIEEAKDKFKDSLIGINTEGWDIGEGRLGSWKDCIALALALKNMLEAEYLTKERFTQHVGRIGHILSFLEKWDIDTSKFNFEVTWERVLDFAHFLAACGGFVFRTSKG